MHPVPTRPHEVDVRHRTYPSRKSTSALWPVHAAVVPRDTGNHVIVVERLVDRTQTVPEARELGILRALDEGREIAPGEEMHARSAGPQRGRHHPQLFDALVADRNAA